MLPVFIRDLAFVLYNSMLTLGDYWRPVFIKRRHLLEEIQYLKMVDYHVYMRR